jgi:predicted nucleotidyltransferase
LHRDRAAANAVSGIEIKAGERLIVQGILENLLPRDAKIWVFGSRAKGKARAASDLDLAVDAGRALTLHEQGRLADAFDEAPLPYKVDVVDIQTVSPAFRAIVEGDRIAWDALL